MIEVDDMADVAAAWRETLRRLAEEPGAASLSDPRTALLLWSLDGHTVLWSSAGAADLAKRVGGPGGTDLRRRLHLAGVAASRSSFRLERLRIGANPLSPPATIAIRIVPFGDGEALLTALPGPRRTEAADTMPDRSPGSVGPGSVVATPDEDPIAEPTRRRGTRFTWKTDREGRFTSVSPQLAASVGHASAAILGRRWGDLSERVVLDATGAVARAFAEAAAWSRLPVLWRAADTDRAVPAELTGSPARGRDGRLVGFRGFGTVYAAEMRAMPPGRFAGLPELDEPPAAASEPPGPNAALDTAIKAAVALTGSAGETVFGALRAWFSPVAGQGASLHEHRRPAAPSETSAPTASSAPTLSSSELGALSEIARALGRPPDPEGALAEPPLRPSAEIVPLRASRPADWEAGRLLDALPLAIVVIRDRVPVFANRRLLDLSGHDDLPSLIAQGGLDGMLDHPVDAPDSGTLPSFGLTARDGAALPVAMRAASVMWGEAPATLVTLTPEPVAQAIPPLAPDIAGRDRRIDELSAMLDLASEGLVTLDQAGRVRSMSASAESLFGQRSGSVAGDGATALLVPDDHAAALACLDAVLVQGPGAVAECDVRTRPRPGTPSARVAMRVGHLERASEARLVLSFRDVSRYRALEDELREARGEAERASANRADFLARISHEIRTPLTAITGFAELMLEERFGPIGSERYRGYMRDIQGSGVHVLSLVNDLLDLAKVTSGRSDLSPTSTDLNAIVRECVAVAAPIATRERTIMRTSYGPALPPAFADERSVRQIVLNVLSNAIRFTGAGGQVIVSTSRVGSGEVMLGVRDTGPGMSRAEIEAALTPFRQVATTRRGDGTGLGLPLSKALVEGNGGTFTIISTPETGTLVEIRLPAATAAMNAIAAE